MTLGPSSRPVGLLLLLRIGPDASYVADVLPGVTVFGLGLCAVGRAAHRDGPGRVEAERAGIASGINNAVARAAGLLAVAVLRCWPALRATTISRPQAFAAGFQTAILMCAGLLVAGGMLAALTIRNPLRARGINRHFCAIEGPPIDAAPAGVHQ